MLPEFSNRIRPNLGDLGKITQSTVLVQSMDQLDPFFDVPCKNFLNAAQKSCNRKDHSTMSEIENLEDNPSSYKRLTFIWNHIPF